MGLHEKDNQTSLPLVLVIDDAEIVHRLLHARLKQEGVRLASAEDGEEGLAMARADEPALILLDLNMPGKDGFQVLRELKADAETLDVPVIVLSGNNETDDKVMAFDLGAVDFVTKPFQLPELRARVRSALRVHELMRMLEQRAQLDGLTGLWNRQYFNERLEQVCETAKRTERPFSLVLLDIDHFKSINDTFGHPAGDAVIKRVASLLSEAGRKTDLACRYGGEEFALIMPDTAPAQAALVCERVRAEIEALHWSRHPERSVTASLGIAGGERLTSIVPAELIEHADQALYRSKQGGRNRVEMTDLSNGPSLRQAG